jgi:hypothetical protein
MVPKERVAAVFQHKPTDKVPIYQAGFSSQVASYVLGREAYVGGGIQQYREAAALWEGEAAHRAFAERSFDDACELCEELDLDLVRTLYWRKPERPWKRVDERTFIYGNRDAGAYWEVWRFDPPSETFGAVAKQARPEPTMEGLARMAEDEVAEAERYSPSPAAFAEYRRATDRFGRTRAVPGSGVGIFIPREPAWLEAVVLCPDTVARHLDAAAIRARKNAGVMAGMGLPYLFGGGDFAGAMGPLYSPRVFHDLMLPRLRLISEACHNVGAYHMFASDGDLWPVAGDLFGASGVDAFYEVDRRFMDLAELRRCFPRLTLLGGVRSEVLHRGAVADVVHETRTALEIARQYGSMIVGCSNQIVAGTPEANFWAMMEALAKYR